MDLELNPSLFRRKFESNACEMSVFLTMKPADRRRAHRNGGRPRLNFERTCRLTATRAATTSVRATDRARPALAARDPWLPNLRVEICPSKRARRPSCDARPATPDRRRCRSGIGVGGRVSAGHPLSPTAGLPMYEAEIGRGKVRRTLQQRPPLHIYPLGFRDGPFKTGGSGGASGRADPP